jgi:hypothetical protein
MRKYRLLMNGRNYLIHSDGKPKKHGFFQDLYLEADNPRQAEALAVARIRFNKELKDAALNRQDDPWVVYLDTIWELDNFNDVGKLESDRTFYIEKKWWQFWKKR